MIEAYTSRQEWNECLFNCLKSLRGALSRSHVLSKATGLVSPRDGLRWMSSELVQTIEKDPDVVLILTL